MIFAKSSSGESQCYNLTEIIMSMQLSEKGEESEESECAENTFL